MKKFIAWLIFSSKDPNKISLTIKATGATVATYIVFFAGLFHLNIGQSDLSSLIDALAQLAGLLLQAVTTVMAIVGFVRKIHTSITGENQVLNSVE
jgi:hypothetical protein